MKGYHKVTITVELDEGEAVFSQSQEFTGGNPIFHASEFFGAVDKPVQMIKKALEAVYGVAPHERGN